MRVKWNKVSKELSPGPDTVINAQPIISVVLANTYWASARSYLIWMTSSCPPPNKPRRQALRWSHFTDEEVKVSDWAKAWTLVIIIICPLATPEEVMVTQQLNKNVSVDRQQLLRLALFRRWKVNKYHIWQKYIFFSSNMLVFYWGIIYIQRNAPMLSLVLNSDKAYSPITITTTLAMPGLLSVSIALPSLEFHINGSYTSFPEHVFEIHLCSWAY